MTQWFDSLTHVTADGAWFGRSVAEATTEQLLREMDAANAARACVVAIAEKIDNDVVVTAAGAHPDRLIPIGSINPGSMTDDRQVDAAVRQLAERGFAGMKLHPRLNGYDPTDARCIVAIRSAAQHGLIVMLDTLFRQPSVPVANAADVVDAIAHTCPDTRVVLLHGGGPALLQVAEVVAQHDHLLLDLSFTMLRYAETSLAADLSYVCRTLDRRVCIGSDFPEYTPGHAREAFETIAHNVTPDQKQNILYQNLTTLFSRSRG